MKFASFTCGYQRRTLELAFSDAKEFGYDGIEIWGCRPHAYAYDLNPERIAAIRRLSDRYGIPVIGFTPKVNSYPFNLMIGERDMWEDSVAYIERAIDASAALDAGFTLIALGHAGDLASPAQIRERVRESLTVLGEYARKKKNLLIVEPLSWRESNTINTARQLAEALQEAGSPAVAGMCDTVVPFVQKRQGIAGETLDTYFDLLGPKLAHVHMTDSDGVSEDHVVPGEGCAPLQDMLRTLRTRGYDGWITLELVTKYIAQPSLYAEKAIRHMRELEKDI
ncbi:MAG: fructoselysine 3-epimerase [Firmicutes bacterium]|nr:fructoselysine 3-epimerase [Bacillota bacterium]